MSSAYVSPADFVNYVAKAGGLWTSGGRMLLNQYMSASAFNGGSGTSQSLCNQLAKMKSKTGGWAGIELQKQCRNLTRVSTGQGYVDDIIRVWSFIHDNLDDVKALKVQTYHTSGEGKEKTEVPGAEIALSKVFVGGFVPGLRSLITDYRCFGWDCIGFVCQYLNHIGHLDEYKSWYSDDYLKPGTNFGQFAPIALDEVAPLCVVVFGHSHIAIVNSVESVTTARGMTTAKVSVCQSYVKGGTLRGPQISTPVILTQSPGSEITQLGILDGQSFCQLGKHPDLVAKYPNAAPSDMKAIAEGTSDPLGI